MGPFPQPIYGIIYLEVMKKRLFEVEETAPLPNQEAYSVAEAIVTYWGARLEVPDYIHTNQG